VEPTENADSWVDPTAWHSRILKYVATPVDRGGGVLECPADRETPISTKIPIKLRYIANEHLFRNEARRGNNVAAKMAGIRAPTETLLITERSSEGYQTAFTAGQFNTVRLRWDNAESRFVKGMVRHNQRCTAAAADGHAETLQMPPVGSVPVDFGDLGDARHERTRGYWRTASGAKLFLRQTASGRDDKNTGGF